MADKTEFRCAYCGKLLAKTDGNTDIKCPRCGSMNCFDAASGEINCIPRKDAKHRITSSGMTFY